MITYLRRRRCSISSTLDRCLVREAEAKAQQKRPTKHRNPPAPTMAVEYWPDSETGANFGGFSSGPPPQAAMEARPMSAGSVEEGTWECGSCTFHNHGSMMKCEICDAPKAPVSSKPAAAIQRKPVAQGSHASYRPPEANAMESALEPAGLGYVIWGPFDGQVEMVSGGWRYPRQLHGSIERDFKGQKTDSVRSLKMLPPYNPA